MKKYILKENKAGKNMNLGKNYLMKQYNMSQDQALNIIGSIKHDIPNSRMADQKFILGLCRMYARQQLTDEDTILQLNAMLKFVASNAHVNEYNNDLNGLSAEDIIDRFSAIKKTSIDSERDELNNQVYTRNNNYQIFRIETPEEAQEPQYADYTDWCVTYDEDMYKNYTQNCEGIFYFCIKNGYEDIPEEKTEGFPLDEYGLSMIAVSVDAEGAPNTITCRWNHNGGNDNIMTPEELSKLLGISFYQAFPPRYTEEERKRLFEEEVEMFRETITWYEETSYEGRYDKYGDEIEEDDEFEFDYNFDNDKIGQCTVTRTKLPWEDYEFTIIKIQSTYGDYDKEMLFSYKQPLLKKFYKSIRYPITYGLKDTYKDLVLLYPNDNYGQGEIFNLCNQIITDKNVYSVSCSRDGYVMITHDNRGFNILKEDGTLLLPINNIKCFGKLKKEDTTKFPYYTLDNKYNIFDLTTNQNVLPFYLDEISKYHVFFDEHGSMQVVAYDNPFEKRDDKTLTHTFENGWQIIVSGDLYLVNPEKKAVSWCGSSQVDIIQKWLRQLMPNEKQQMMEQVKNNRLIKKVIRLTESDLHRIVKNCVNRIIKENMKRKTL